MLILNQTQKIDYPQVQTQKDSFLRDYYAYHGEETSLSSIYKQFLQEESHWLLPYAAFKACKIITHWQPWKEWPATLSETYENELKKEEDYQIFLQFLCFQQLREVKKKADDQHIKLKGDLPIFIDQESADVWNNQELFSLDIIAGSPPDMYAEEGQYWGFPIYNWSIMQKEGYQWWIARLKTAEKFYHIYRLDHIVGFFRVWAIPRSKEAKEGFFLPENHEEWLPQGERFMQTVLKNSWMLPIGEDLGTVPPEVRDSLRALGICGTKVMRWERNWHGDKSFINPMDYPAESMTTVSTHDSEPLALWWQDHPDEASLYAASQGWDYSSILTQEQRLAILYASHHSGSLFHINPLQEYLTLIPGMTHNDLQKERVNIPGTVSTDNWSYKFIPSVEAIVTNESLKQHMKSLLLKHQ